MKKYGGFTMFSNYQEVNMFLEGRKQLGVKPGLDRVYFLLERLGNPERTIRAIHVAGTNGKGSTSTYIKEILGSGGWKVGTYTTPHITGLKGEIEIDGKQMTDTQSVRLVNRMLPAIQALDDIGNPPTAFEIKTVAAFCFLDENAEISVIETGMGGLEDATNCFIPILSIITNVGLDHQRMLGETIAAIASHKAGIIKQHVPLVLGDVTEEAASVILKKAKGLRSPVYQIFKDFTVTNVTAEHPEYTEFTFECNGLSQEAVISMAGRHQVKNAALALMAVKLLEDCFPMEWKRVLQGLQRAAITGRFEKVHDHPAVIIDAAHNPEGLAAFLQTVEYFYSDKKKRLLFAAFKDKPLQKMLSQLGNDFQSVHFTSFPHERAASAEVLQTHYPGKNSKIEKWENVIRNHLGSTGESILFITGSLYFIELVRKFFVKR
ncbi:bifunctional folylpolyglutamate synthase/dihydrofolate synthase [Sediminibacillus dalangtanensis]|uniref:tetrahydrofolate synthase n=1 Tax=Sediminibacillus dalangtanensis TaxID=2729421 RepID=A0ABX7VWV1_9BACI|nr:folylpolyglutamate synthase/dihydrofolate synthase family protein [Sediminibacillus dalangtanensis]QTM99973.1 bifunctional folylpolyglutamate synthase/dihydrofolate synthase [Sediminibacillus dalangtanensis]